ncbi:Uncharacterised protein [Mycobacteroides abscessus subsp. abscessus]|nr:Uncharacterised protein [Mycobacteroides abscessus subsp. abscessus]
MRQSSKFPSTSSSVAPWATAWLIFPGAILPAGTSTAHVRPAFVAYAAAEAEVLPVDAQITAFAPCAFAFVIAIVIPRSLNDPVGLRPSYLTHTSAPVIALSFSARMSGVPPSPRVTDGMSAAMSSRLRYSSMTPCHWWRGYWLFVTGVWSFVSLTGPPPG